MAERVEIHGEVMAWRREQRATLIAARIAMPADAHRLASRAIRERLKPLVETIGPAVLAGYCTIRREFDPLPFLRECHAAGVQIALPVVCAKNQPLEFRLWHPGARMAVGVYDIPYPADGAVVVPAALLIPMVGYDAAGYRLGYGGGYYDRTLAALSPRPRPIGISFEFARVDTIRPLPHDIPMEYVVTERGSVGPV